jgi:hypothetical protein
MGDRLFSLVGFALLLTAGTALAQDPLSASFIDSAAKSAPRGFSATEAPPSGLVAVHRCTTTNSLSKSRVPGLAQSQTSTVTTRFGAYSASSFSVNQTLHITTGEFVEEYRIAVPIWWLPYGLAAEERRIPQPGTESGFLLRGTTLMRGSIPELDSKAREFKAGMNEDMDWATHMAYSEPQFTHFSTPKEVTVSASAPVKVTHPALGAIEVVHLSVEIRDADSPARQEWKRDYVPSLWVPVSFVRRDFNVKSQPVREIRCELESYTRP